MSKHPSDERILHYQSKFKKIKIPGKAHRCFPGPTLISYSSDSESDSNSGKYFLLIASVHSL